MEKTIIDSAGKIGVFLAYIVNLSEWQSVNIIFTCILSILSCVYIVFKILSLRIDYKMKKDGMRKEREPLRSKIKRFVKK